MMGGPSCFNLFVTSIAQDKWFLKIWGQKDHSTASKIERMILENSVAFERNEGVPAPATLQAGQLCCARYHDNCYYRASITAVDPVSRSASLVFVDYGNPHVAPLSDLRIPLKDASELFSIPPQATCYILSEVTGNWDESTVRGILAVIGYEEHKCSVVGSVGPQRDINLLKLYFQGKDYAQVLCEQNLAKFIPFTQFEVMVEQSYSINLMNTMNSLPLKSGMMQPGYGNMAPYSHQMMNFPNPMWSKMINPMTHYTGFPNMTMTGFATPNSMPCIPNLPYQSSLMPSLSVKHEKPSNSSQQTVVTFHPNSEHKVTVSNVEGFGNIAVQLKADEEELLNLMSNLNNESVPRIAMRPPSHPGSKCAARYSVDGSLCRAVVVGYEGDKCKVYYTDYGNSEVVDWEDIIELPSTLGDVRPMAYQFSLSGLKKAQPTDEMKEVFKEMMKTAEDITMKVRLREPEEPPSKLYCELYINDTDVKELVNMELMKKRSKPKLRCITPPEVGSVEDVLVSFVTSTDNFFVQLTSKQRELEEMMTQLNEYCQHNADKLQLSEIIPGTVCCALYTGDSRWYRACVVDAALDSLRVFYVDYGNEEQVSPDDLRAVDCRWFKLRSQAIPCELSGFGDIKNESLSDRFEEIALEQSFKMQVVQQRKGITKRDKYSIVVKLFMETGEDISNLLLKPCPSTGVVLQSGNEVLNRTKQNSPRTDQTSSQLVDRNPRPIDRLNEHSKRFGDDKSDLQIRRGYRTSGEDRTRNGFRHENRSEKGNDYPAYEEGRPKECNWGTTPDYKSGKQYILHCDRTETEHGEESHGRHERGGRTHSDQEKPRNSSRYSKDQSKDSDWNANSTPKSSYNGGPVTEESWGEETPSTSQVSLTMLKPTTGNALPVYVVFSNSPSDFYVQIRGSDDLSALMDEISQEFTSGGEILSPSDLKEGAVCVAMYEADQTWYRAVIKKVYGDSVDVFFSDYGNMQTVKKNELKRIKPNMTTLQSQAIHCSLIGTPSAGWSDDQVASFNELSELETLEATFVEVCSDSVYKIILKDGNACLNEVYGATPDSMLSPSTIVSSIQSQNVVPGSVHEAIVSWFVNPSQFYLQLKSSQGDFKSVMEKIQKSYRNKERISTAVIDEMVVARFREDNSLYRAQVKILKGSKFGVRYVDYGNKSLVDEIYGLEHQFATLPTQAILCSLAGVQPAEETWPKNNPQIDQLFKGEITCTFHGSKVDSKQPVEMVSISCNGLDVAQQLIEMNLARNEEPQLSSVQALEDYTMEHICHDLLKGQIIQSVVTACAGTTIFVNLEPDLTQNIKERIQALIQDSHNLHALPAPLVVPSQLCLTYFEESQNYKRAKILDPAGKAGILVHCIDDGSVEEVGASSLFSLAAELAAIPPQAIECVIHDSENSIDTKSGLKSLLDQNVTLVIQNVVEEKLMVNLLDCSGQPFPFLPCAPSPVSICTLPVVRRRMQVCVTHASGTSVWLQRACDTDRISQLLADLFATLEEAEYVPRDWTLKEVCAAKSEDGNWYRGIVDDMGDSGASIFYVDYGNNETVPVENLRLLPPEYVSHPAFAFKASLPLLSCAESTHDTIVELTAEKVFVAVFGKDCEGQLLVELLEGDDELSKKLILSGQAVPLENNPLTPLLKKEVLEMKLTPGLSARVYVALVASPSEIYVQLTDFYDQLQKLQEDLQTVSLCMKPLDSPDVGIKCMALYTDEVWYRGRVQPDKKIYFIDYGNVESVETSCLKALPPAVCQIPDFAIRCCLPAPEGKAWCSETTTRLQDLLLEREDIVVKVLAEIQGSLQVDFLLDGKSVSDILHLEGLINESVPKSVFISYHISPGDFWVCENDAAAQLDEMNLESGNDLHVVDQGIFCAALFDDDGLWYRAQVEMVHDSGCSVRFIDYGNSTVASKFRSLSPEWSSVPPLAKHCCLCSPDQEWSDASKSRFSELAADGSTVFSMNVVEEGDPAVVNLSIDGRGIDVELLSLCCNEVSPIDSVAPSDNVPSNSLLKAFVAFANTPSDFYMHLESDVKAVQGIEEALLDAHKFEDLVERLPGTVCAAKFPDDEQWYRACILACNDNNVEVSFIDYGNTSVCTEFKSLPIGLQGPPLAKHCTLPHLDSSSTWSAAAVAKFLELVSDPETEFLVEFFGSKDPVVANLEILGRSIVLEVAELSGVDHQTMEQLISALRKTQSGERPKGFKNEELSSYSEQTTDHNAAAKIASDDTVPLPSCQPGDTSSMVLHSNSEAEGVDHAASVVEQTADGIEDVVEGEGTSVFVAMKEAVNGCVGVSKVEGSDLPAMMEGAADCRPKEAATVGVANDVPTVREEAEKETVTCENVAEVEADNQVSDYVTGVDAQNSCAEDCTIISEKVEETIYDQNECVPEFTGDARVNNGIINPTFKAEAADPESLSVVGNAEVISMIKEHSEIVLDHSAASTAHVTSNKKVTSSHVEGNGSPAVLVELLTFPSPKHLLAEDCVVSHGFSQASEFPHEFAGLEPGVETFRFSECVHSMNVEVQTNDPEEEVIEIVQTELISSVLLVESDQIAENLKNNPILEPVAE